MLQLTYKEIYIRDKIYIKMD